MGVSWGFGFYISVNLTWHVWRKRLQPWTSSSNCHESTLRNTEGKFCTELLHWVRSFLFCPPVKWKSVERSPTSVRIPSRGHVGAARRAQGPFGFSAWIIHCHTWDKNICCINKVHTERENSSIKWTYRVLFAKCSLGFLYSQVIYFKILLFMHYAFRSIFYIWWLLAHVYIMQIIASKLLLLLQRSQARATTQP